MTPFHDTGVSRLNDGPAVLNEWEAASISGAVCGIQAIAGLLLHHEACTESDGDDLLQLNSASVGGLLEAMGGLAELIDLRLREGATRAQKAQRQGGIA